MSQTIEVKVPDIGNFKDVAVIEVLVKAGDTVEPEQSLITMETDKATMDVPSPVAGVVKQLKLKVGDRVSMGSLILLLESATQDAGTRIQDSAQPAPPAPSTPNPESRILHPESRFPAAGSHCPC